ncbi:UNVERIFIED_CONTAM: hypothetical protein Sradi_5667800 [Sesamum radiatum]|uniref:Retrotransposon Copia-like N-terminal domain-containing protein n=1 Tax=Sesamum radiatum TaxID=300843 RepID=A0AAW2L353_SESRA
MASSSSTTPEVSGGGSGIEIINHPGMVMISAPLNGNNWLSWSRSISILMAGVGGSIWECDGPLLYKIQREINSMSQGNQNVTAYYTNLKQLWDELVCLMPPAMCTCGKCTCDSNKTKIEQTEASQLIQFLTGLNDSYDNIRNQILVLDPLPHVNKAYSMVLRVERQRQVNMSIADLGDNSAFYSRDHEQKGNQGGFRYMKKKGTNDKKNAFCEVCNKTGHNKDTCFKVHGVPDLVQGPCRTEEEKWNRNQRIYGQ